MGRISIRVGAFLKSKRQSLVVLNKIDKYFPFIKTAEEFDFHNQQGVTKWHLEKLSEREWIDKWYNVLMLGGAGMGKTHLAVAVGLKAIRNVQKVLYTTENELLFCLKTQSYYTSTGTIFGRIDEIFEDNRFDPYWKTWFPHQYKSSGVTNIRFIKD